MVSFSVYRSTTSGFYVEGVCLITDEKPVVGIANGSILHAVDTSSGETTRFMYDQSTMSWIEAECPCAGGSGGSGSGGGGGGVFNVNLSGDELVADKTFQEISEAFDAGAIIPCYTYTEKGNNRRLYGFISGTKQMLGPRLVLTPLGVGDPILSLSVPSTDSYPQFSDGGVN